MQNPGSKNHMEQLSFDSLLEESSEPINSDSEVDETTTKTDRNTFPIHLVTDFERFMEYIEQHNIKLTSTNAYISRKHLPVLNERMSVKADNATSNYSQQQYYPYIHLFYHIALNGKLTMKTGKSQQSHLDVTDRWNVFKNLTDTEKYFFLLETFWVDVNWPRLLNERNNTIHHVLPDILEKLINPRSGFRLDLHKETLVAHLISDWNYFLLYLEWFGFWITEEDLEKKSHHYRKNSYFAKTITLTGFGKNMLPIFIKSRSLLEWNIPLRWGHGEVNPIPGSVLPDGQTDQVQAKNQNPQTFHQAFASLYPKRDLYKSLPRTEREFQEGTHTFTVSFDKHTWRKVVLSANHTMDDLHKIILRAFDFDDDHLYSFFMDGEKWSNACIASPGDSSGSTDAAETTIGSAGLYHGQRLLYLYDYGDEWLFTVTVDGIYETVDGPINPYIQDAVGYSPEQYIIMDDDY